MIDKKITQWLFVAFLAFYAVCLGIGSPIPWTGLGYLWVALVFICAGASLTPSSLWLSTNDFDDWVFGVRWILVTFIIGASIGIASWYVSLYLFKSLFPGTLGILVFSLFGLTKIYKKENVFILFFSNSLPTIVFIITLALSFYITGINEVQFGDDILFTYRFDWSLHLAWSSFIREFGLPMVGASGSPGVPFHSVGHRGFLVLLAGVENLTQGTLYQSGRILAGFFFPIIGLFAIAITARYRLSKFEQVLIGMAPLIWGSFSLPMAFISGNFESVFDPLIKASFKPAAPSGVLYHNLTQLASVSFSAVSLVCIDRFCKYRTPQLFAVAVILLVFSGLIKPSLIIVLGPALLILMVVKRERLNIWLIFLIIIAIFVFWYFLPSLMNDLPKRLGWKIVWGNMMDPELPLRIFLVLGLVIPVCAYWLYTFFCRLKLLRDWLWYDVVMIGLFGAVLFSALFKESLKSTNNQNWPLTGILVLISPYVLANALSWVKSIVSRRGLFGVMISYSVASALALIIMLHLVGGSMYAAHYPTFSKIKVSSSLVESIKEIAQKIDKADRLFVDLEITRRPYTSYFAHPHPWRHTIISEESRDFIKWKRVLNGKKINDLAKFINSRDAIIIQASRSSLKKQLKELNWNQQIISSDGNIEIWKKRE